MQMDGAPILLYCPKPRCKLSLCGFLHSSCHIGLYISHWCVILIAMHITLLFAFFRAELWIIFMSYSHNCHVMKNKITLQAIICQNVMVFLPKTLSSFFQKQEKLERCRNFNLTNFRRPFFWDDINLSDVL